MVAVDSIYIHHLCAVLSCMYSYTIIIFVGCCLATKVFIGKFLVTGGVWVNIEQADDERGHH